MRWSFRSLVRVENNRTEYFPTIGTFAILNDQDEKYVHARDGVLKVLYTLINLYEVDDTCTQYTREQLIDRVRARYDSIDPDEISLGLYLVVSDFGAIQSYARSSDGTQISSFTIAEQVLKIADPAAEFVKRVAIARNNASAPPPTFQAAARMKLDDAVYATFETAIQPSPSEASQTDRVPPNPIRGNKSTPSGCRFQVALSFPGESRARVQQIAENLAISVPKESILYDRWLAPELARPNLDIYLTELYKKDSLLLVFFLSGHYAQKEWCGLEWRVGRDLIKQKQEQRLMPLRLDDAEIPGLHSIDGFLDIRGLSDVQVANAILQRLDVLNHFQPAPIGQSGDAPSGKTEDSLRRQREARRLLAPELQRTIDRVLYIHGRAVANFLSHSADAKVKPTDLKQDFLPHWPKLYPNASQVRDLAAEDAAALIAYYDSLHALNDDVNDWWGREGQLPVNLFNVFLHRASKCLRLALVCIVKFELESLIPSPYESWGTISSRIHEALKSEEQVRHAHLERFEANTRK